ncbi:MAG TPA: hypothetical protein VNA20_05570 [Frankiaceae bacterium]|nr:hypothetical protein [Frankiaceae bacterium]
MAGVAALGVLLMGAALLTRRADGTRQPTPSTPALPTPPLTTPYPGRVVNAEALPWSRAVRVDDRTLDLYYDADASGCTVLSNVRVAESPSAVTLTLYVGSPRPTPGICTGGGVIARVRVPLSAPLASRPVLDGGTRPTPDPRPVATP